MTKNESNGWFDSEQWNNEDKNRHWKWKEGMKFFSINIYGIGDDHYYAWQHSKRIRLYYPLPSCQGKPCPKRRDPGAVFAPTCGYPSTYSQMHTNMLKKAAKTGIWPREQATSAHNVMFLSLGHLFSPCSSHPLMTSSDIQDLVIPGTLN